MIYLNYALGTVVMMALLSFFVWTFKDIQKLSLGQKKKKTKRKERPTR